MYHSAAKRSTSKTGAEGMGETLGRIAGQRGELSACKHLMQYDATMAVFEQVLPDLTKLEAGLKYQFDVTLVIIRSSKMYAGRTSMPYLR